MLEHSYFTTTLPYINSVPHLGFALELVFADTAARTARLLGKEVFLNTGTDEHGLKIYRSSTEAGLEPTAYATSASKRFHELVRAINVLPEVNFIRTTDPKHVSAARDFWRRSASSGDIYLNQQEVKYCVGCELEKTDSELFHGRCSLHPNKELEILAEENYFFRFSKYQKRLLELFNSRADFVVPNSRLGEIRSFVEGGLRDFSISRLAEKQPWGVPVPGDDKHTMYVWFDALVNYLTAIGWPEDPSGFEYWWPVIQFAGKDNLRQQAAMWQAMLMSAGLPPSRQIVIHGFITSNGQKMSKSLGNVVDPFELIERYGADSLRYYLLRHITPFEDGDFTQEKFDEAYNGGLAKGLGNLVSRVMKMASTALDSPARVVWPSLSSFSNLVDLVGRYEFNQGLDLVWRRIALHDKYIQDTKPFALTESDPTAAREHIGKLVQGLADISVCLEPFMPQTAKTIKELIESNQPPATPLFPRK